jgi:hypothetical protein
MFVRRKIKSSGLCCQEYVFGELFEDDNWLFFQ